MGPDQLTHLNEEQAELYLTSETLAKWFIKKCHPPTLKFRLMKTRGEIDHGLHLYGYLRMNLVSTVARMLIFKVYRRTDEHSDRRQAKNVARNFE